MRSFFTDSETLNHVVAFNSYIPTLLCRNFWISITYAHCNLQAWPCTSVKAAATWTRTRHFISLVPVKWKRCTFLHLQVTWARDFKGTNRYTVTFKGDRVRQNHVNVNMTFLISEFNEIRTMIFLVLLTYTYLSVCLYWGFIDQWTPILQTIVNLAWRLGKSRSSLFVF